MNNRIMAIDDDPAILDYYRMLIGGEDGLDLLIASTQEKEFLLETFAEGAALLDRFRNETQAGRRIPLCVVDMRMTPMDGMTVATRLREIDPEVIIVLATAFSDLSAQEIRERLQDDIYFVKKPFNTEEFASLLTSLMKSWNRLQTLKAREATLSRLSDDLEQKVKERTRELAATNKELQERIAAQQQAEDLLLISEDRFRRITENSTDITVILDKNSICKYVSPSAEHLFKLRVAEILGQNLFSLIHEPDKPKVDRALREALATPGKTIRLPSFRVRPTGSNRAYLEGMFIAMVGTPGIDGVVVNCRDITDRYLAETKIQYLAYYDSLTSLPNRSLFRQSLNTEVARAKQSGDRPAVLFVDLDRFKNVNDSLGHDTGDRLLQSVAERLKYCVRRRDVVARLGGDEFPFLLTNSNGEPSARSAADRIIKALSKPFQIDNYRIHITPSIGIAIYPEHGEDAETLLRNADTAMYHAKECGKNRYQLYDKRMNIRTSHRLQMENGLRDSINKGELEVYYQPIVDLKSRRVVEFEALLRWKHPELGFVSPAEFIPIAEETGLILEITEWVLKTACHQISIWSKASSLPISVGVNISPRHFFLGGLEDLIRQALDEHKIEPRQLNLEITESAVIEDEKLAIQTLSNLRELGVETSLDDFGTGYSSLSYLKILPLNYAKIDISFVRDITKNNKNSIIAEAIIDLSHRIGLQVVAEGVEEEAQLRFLDNLGCDLVQGYLLGRPKPSEEASQMVATVLQF